MSPKYIRNAGKHWTPAEEKQLKVLAKENTPTASAPYNLETRMMKR